MQGRVPDLAMSHTASRIIQACAKHGTDADRRMILAEATPRVVDLAKSSYGHFLLCKLITAAPKKEFPGTACLHMSTKLYAGHADDVIQHCVILPMAIMNCHTRKPIVPEAWPELLLLSQLFVCQAQQHVQPE